MSWDDAANATPDLGQVPRTLLPQHPLTRYVRNQFEVTDGVLRWVVRRTLLGVLPVGVRQVQVPLPDIREVRVPLGLHPLRLIVGVACIIVPLVLGFGWGAAPSVAIGAWIALVSFGPQLQIVTRAGDRYRAGVCYGHRIDAQLYARAVNDLMPGVRTEAAGRAVTL